MDIYIYCVKLKSIHINLGFWLQIPWSHMIYTNNLGLPRLQVTFKSKIFLKQPDTYSN